LAFFFSSCATSVFQFTINAPTPTRSAKTPITIPTISAIVKFYPEPPPPEVGLVLLIAVRATSFVVDGEGVLLLEAVRLGLFAGEELANGEGEG